MRSPFFARAFLASSLALVFAPLAAACGRQVDEASSLDAGPTTSAARANRAPATAPAAARSGEGWNAGEIDWQPYEAGLVRAKAQNKPVCLVFYTTWCPHCRNFSHIFEDPRVVAKARDFVMVHLDADAEEAVASKYSLDGTYIPRTFFLAPDGTVDGSIHAPRERSRYFYDEQNPNSLLAAMETARKKLVN
jgi:thiol-disulfide isomerase/thioredoxin